MINKYAMNPIFRQWLVATSPHPLIYDSEDPYWGRGSHNDGKNHLGRILEEVRKRHMPSQEALTVSKLRACLDLRTKSSFFKITLV